MRVGVAGAALHVSRVPLRTGDGRRRVREGEEGEDAGAAAALPAAGAGGPQHPPDPQPRPRAEREHRWLPREGGHRAVSRRLRNGERERERQRKRGGEREQSQALRTRRRSRCWLPTRPLYFTFYSIRWDHPSYNWNL